MTHLVSTTSYKATCTDVFQTDIFVRDRIIVLCIWYLYDPLHHTKAIIFINPAREDRNIHLG